MLGLFALVGFAAGFYYFGRFNEGPMLGLFVAAALFQLVWLSLLAAAFRGMQKRKNWARWLTVGVFVYLILSMAVNTLFGLSQMTSSAMTGGYMIGTMIFIIPFGFLIFRLAFGDAAVDFFKAPEPDEASLSTPPPPSFDDPL